MSESPTPSPLPWTSKFVAEGGYDSLTDAYYIKDANGRIVAELDKGRDNKPECEPNADLIVRSVNAHAALVEALKAVEWSVSYGAESICPLCLADEPEGHTPDCRIAAALALAEPKS